MTRIPEYTGKYLERVTYPMGGIGSGMICLEGNGALSGFSLRHKPDLVNRPIVFGALHCRSGDRCVSRVLEGPVPEHLVRGRRIGGSMRWLGRTTLRLPRFRECSFSARFPFGTARLVDPDLPIEVEVTGWSPFIPGDADNSSLPVCAVEYCLRNTGSVSVGLTWSFHAENMLRWPGGDFGVRRITGGLVLSQYGNDARPADEGHLAILALTDKVHVDGAWLRGMWNDTLMQLWDQIASGQSVDAEPHADGKGCFGGSLYKAVSLDPGQEVTMPVLLGWYVPDSGFFVEAFQYKEPTPDRPSYKPWYATRFADIDSVIGYWQEAYSALRSRTAVFTDCFYDTDIPAKVVDAAGSNLPILKSTTIYRQSDGRIWCWEGSNDTNHFCFGSCTHVWNYAQAMAHLFPELERGLRRTEFGEAMEPDGCQHFRVPLPIRAAEPFQRNDAVSRPLAVFVDAADGQLGGILKVYRDWRIAGDQSWLRGIWPNVVRSMDYCIRKWDPRRTGLPEEPQHNTYDIEFWGPNGMCGSFYLSALEAFCRMGNAMGEDVADYRELLQRGCQRMESELFNGEYFEQRAMTEGLDAELVNPKWSPEVVAETRAHGPRYQYGTGCLADGVLGLWLAAQGGIDALISPNLVRSHLLAVYKYNLRRNLSGNFGTLGREGGEGDESGVLVCTWPRGGRPKFPVVYDYEVWPGIEYQVAGHLMMHGCVEEGLDIVRCVRSRFNGQCGNPFDETEHSHYYGRILSSYALLGAITGIRYDAVDKTLYVAPPIAGDFRAFICTDTGFGTAGVRNGLPFLEIVSGNIEVEHTSYIPAR